LWVWFVFPWWLMILNTFSCFCWPSVNLLWKNVCSYPLTIFLSRLCFLVLSYVSSLHILNKSPLPDTWFVIFSQPVVYVWIFLTMSFEEEKFLILMKFNLSSFYFLGCDLHTEKIFNTSPQRFSPYVFFQKFHSFTFKSMIHGVISGYT